MSNTDMVSVFMELWSRGKYAHSLISTQINTEVGKSTCEFNHLRRWWGNPSRSLKVRLVHCFSKTTRLFK